jgi:hypothetical protein
VPCGKRRQAVVLAIRSLRDHPNAHKAPRGEAPDGWRFIAAKITLPHVCFRIISLSVSGLFLRREVTGDASSPHQNRRIWDDWSQSGPAPGAQIGSSAARFPRPEASPGARPSRRENPCVAIAQPLPASPAPSPAKPAVGSDIATPTGAGLHRRAEADPSVAAAGQPLDAEAQQPQVPGRRGYEVGMRAGIGGRKES